jgi:bacillithiol system protein YtxJ
VALKERLQFLTSVQQVDEFLNTNRDSVIFKAGTCHKTQETFAQVQPLLEARPDLPVAVIRVLEARAASNRAAELSGIRHQSPQFLLFAGGRAVFDRDNWEITASAVADALEIHLSRPPAAAWSGG